jgi:hypothetical protein
MLTELGSPSGEVYFGGEGGGGGACGGGVDEDGGGVAVRFAVATSGEPSPLKSPMLTEMGEIPSGEVYFGGEGGGGGACGGGVDEDGGGVAVTVRRCYIW